MRTCIPSPGPELDVVIDFFEKGDIAVAADFVLGYFVDELDGALVRVFAETE